MISRPYCRKSGIKKVKPEIMNRATFTPLFTFLLLACNQTGNGSSTPRKSAARQATTPPAADSARCVQHISLPEGFSRIPGPAGSFTAFLRGIGLKKNNTVYLYNGQPKGNQRAQYAVLNVPVGRQDLQQCADAVMRLRAEYLFARQQYGGIVFYDNSRKRYAFAPPYTRENFERFMQRVFGMCGSASLEKQLQPVGRFADIQPGDVLIRGGFPGHAEIVMDVAQHENGNKIYLLAQSYMPAQDIHILKNPGSDDGSPWYEVNTDDDIIVTPEYSFYKRQLRRW